MSYQGWASGDLIVHTKDPEQRKIATECIEEESDNGCLHPFPPYRVSYGKSFELEVSFDCEIRHYFSDNLEEFIKKLQEKLPGVKVTGKFWMSAENDVPYRMEVDSTREDGEPPTTWESIDWLMQYSCKDIEKIRKYAEKNYKEDPIA